ncbi:hypothetical protein ACFPOA_03165 [Lysobacter niabensis]|uniref:hypothetical protein n=1 Tax=Agrilutibacter niabensis TaxID=380628 RepID=UPI003623D831
MPDRANGRTKDHTERYCIARLLATVAGDLDYPFMIVHDDRPDFVLVSVPSRIGIEHTEVVPENVARASFLRSKGLGPNVYFTPRATFGEERKTAQELKGEIERDEPSGGWYGESPERETADAIAGFSLSKLTSSQKDGYRLFDKNWLLLYNNWPAPAVDLGKSASMAYPKMLSDGVFSTFERVYIIDSQNLIILSAAGVQTVALVDPGVES